MHASSGYHRDQEEGAQAELYGSVELTKTPGSQLCRAEKENMHFQSSQRAQLLIKFQSSPVRLVPPAPFRLERNPGMFLSFRSTIRPGQHLTAATTAREDTGMCLRILVYQPGFTS